jgi:heterodisulfide reductase subunit A-like polyferredoxin
MSQPTRILYCHCAYAQVVPKEVKEEVLRQLAASGVAFDAVPDLCELSAKGDPSLARLAGEGDVKIAACYPRAVKWLFTAAGVTLPEQGVEILNMRTEPAEKVVFAILGQGFATTAGAPKEAL